MGVVRAEQTASLRKEVGDWEIERWVGACRRTSGQTDVRTVVLGSEEGRQRK
jgi:hypothetical protein